MRKILIFTSIILLSAGCFLWAVATTSAATRQDYNVTYSIDPVEIGCSTVFPSADCQVLWRKVRAFNQSSPALCTTYWLILGPARWFIKAKIGDQQIYEIWTATSWEDGKQVMRGKIANYVTQLPDQSQDPNLDGLEYISAAPDPDARNNFFTHVFGIVDSSNKPKCNINDIKDYNNIHILATGLYGGWVWYGAGATYFNKDEWTSTHSWPTKWEIKGVIIKP